MALLKKESFRIISDFDTDEHFEWIFLSKFLHWIVSKSQYKLDGNGHHCLESRPIFYKHHLFLKIHNFSCNQFPIVFKWYYWAWKDFRIIQDYSFTLKISNNHCMPYWKKESSNLWPINKSIFLGKNMANTTSHKNLH